MEIIGILVVSGICAVAAFSSIGIPWVGLGFGGPTVKNWLWMAAGLVCAGLVVLGWWHLVGSKIHLGFG